MLEIAAPPQPTQAATCHQETNQSVRGSPQLPSLFGRGASRLPSAGRIRSFATRTRNEEFANARRRI